MITTLITALIWCITIIACIYVLSRAYFESAFLTGIAVVAINLSAAFFIQTIHYNDRADLRQTIEWIKPDPEDPEAMYKTTDDSFVRGIVWRNVNGWNASAVGTFKTLDEAKNAVKMFSRDSKEREVKKLNAYN